MIQDLTQTINGIKENVQSLTDNKSNLDRFVTSTTEKLNLIDELRKNREEDAFKIKLLTATVIKQEQKIDELIQELGAMKKQSRKSNIIIDGLLEADTESPTARKEIVSNFFKEQLEIEEEIEVKETFRFGKANPRS